MIISLSLIAKYLNLLWNLANADTINYYSQDMLSGLGVKTFFVVTFL